MSKETMNLNDFLNEYCEAQYYEEGEWEAEDCELCPHRTKCGELTYEAFKELLID